MVGTGTRESGFCVRPRSHCFGPVEALIFVHDSICM